MAADTSGGAESLGLIDLLIRRLDGYANRLSKVARWTEHIDIVAQKLTSHYAAQRSVLGQHDTVYQRLLNYRAQTLDAEGNILEGQKRNYDFLQKTIDRLAVCSSVVESIETSGLRNNQHQKWLVKFLREQVFPAFRSLNQNLIEANSLLEHRQKLFMDSLGLMGDTGVRFDKITAAAKSLVGYGEETSVSWQNSLRIVTMLGEGIGVATDKAAELAVVVQNRVGRSFKEAADVAATLVNQTALTGEQATDVVQRMYRLTGRFGDAFSDNAKGISTLVGRYESAIKEVGGQQGAFLKYLEQISSPEGYSAGGLIGTFGADVLRNMDSVEEVFSRLTELMANLDGLDANTRQQQMAAYAKMLGMSLDDMETLRRASERLRAGRLEEISVEERFAQQMRASAKSYDQMIQQLRSLLIRGLEPVMNVLTSMAATASNLLTSLNRTFISDIAAMAVTVAGFSSVVFGLHRVFRGLGFAANHLISMASRSVLGRGLATAVGTQVAAGTAGSAAGGAAARVGGWAMIRQILPRIAAYIAGLTGPVGLLVAGVGAVGYGLYRYHRSIVALQEENKKDLVTIGQRAQDLREKQEARVQNELFAGNFEGVLDALYGRENEQGLRIGGLVRSIIDENPSMTPAEVNRQVRDIVEPIFDLYRAGLATQGLSTDSKGNAVLVALEARIATLDEAIKRGMVAGIEASLERSRQRDRNEREREREVDLLKTDIPAYRNKPHVINDFFRMGLAPAP